MIACVAAFSVLLPMASPQGPLAAPQNPMMRYVDFHEALDRPGLLVVVGTLDKLKEGRRERVEGGVLGGATQQISVSGTQYFKVPVSAPIAVRAVLAGGTKGKVAVEFDMQLARLPDGKERRQAMTSNGATIEPGMLALWVLAPQPKGKGTGLLHVIPFDPQADKGDDPEAGFLETMRDFVAINQRVHDLAQAIDAFEHADGAGAKAKAREALAQVVDAKFETKRPDLAGLVSSKVGPFEQRARSRLAESDK